jgi:hypothetical protein
MRGATGRKRILRMARRALLTYPTETGVRSLPSRLKSINPLFRLAHMARFDRPVTLSMN